MLIFLFVSYSILGHPVYGLKHDYKNILRRFQPILRSSAAHVAYVAHVAVHVVAPKRTFIQRTYKDIQSSRETSTL